MQLVHVRDESTQLSTDHALLCISGKSSNSLVFISVVAQINSLSPSFGFEPKQLAAANDWF